MRTLLPLLLTLGLAACPSPHADRPPRFQKLDGQGQEMALDQGPWACVLDRATGLTWEVKSLNEDQHYHQATYSWFEAATGTGRPDGGDCASDRDYYGCDSQDLVDLARAQRWCGVDGWRLPTRTELQTLVHRNAPAGEPRAHNGLFPFLLKAPYWTAELKRTPQGLRAAVIHFGDGGTTWLPPSLAARLLLVRSSRGDTDRQGGEFRQAQLHR